MPQEMLARTHPESPSPNMMEKETKNDNAATDALVAMPENQ